MEMKQVSEVSDPSLLNNYLKSKACVLLGVCVQVLGSKADEGVSVD